MPAAAMRAGDYRGQRRGFNSGMLPICIGTYARPLRPVGETGRRTGFKKQRHDYRH